MLFVVGGKNSKIYDDFCVLVPRNIFICSGEQNETLIFVKGGQERKIFYSKILPPRDSGTVERGGANRVSVGCAPKTKKTHI